MRDSFLEKLLDRRCGQLFAACTVAKVAMPRKLGASKPETEYTGD